MVPKHLWLRIWPFYSVYEAPHAVRNPLLPPARLAQLARGCPPPAADTPLICLAVSLVAKGLTAMHMPHGPCMGVKEWSFCLGCSSPPVFRAKADMTEDIITCCELALHTDTLQTLQCRARQCSLSSRLMMPASFPSSHMAARSSLIHAR